MKTILLIALVALLPSGIFAQVPDKQNPQSSDPDLQTAKDLAVKFVDAVECKRYQNAARMIDPKSPYRTGKSEAYVGGDIRSFEKWNEKRKDLGNPDSHAISPEPYTDSARPNDEKFVFVSFVDKYADGRKVIYSVQVMKKSGNFSIVRYFLSTL